MLAQLDGTQPVARVRVGLQALERVPVREPAPLQTPDGTPVGQVTSGLLSPTLDRPIAMGYVTREHGLPPAPGCRRWCAASRCRWK